MGVDLGELFKKETISFDDLQDKVVAIDAYNVLHQFLAIIRQRDGTPLKDAEGRITSHLSGLLYRTANMAEARIRPVYVFDGAPHINFSEFRWLPFAISPGRPSHLLLGVHSWCHPVRHLLWDFRSHRSWEAQRF